MAANLRPPGPEPAAAGAGAPAARPARRAPDLSSPTARRALAVVAVLVLLAGLALAVRLVGDDGGGGDQQQTSSESPTTTAAGEASSTTAAGGEESTTTATEATTTTTAAEQGQVPEGWTEFTDPGGAYTIAYPSGWEVRPRASQRIDFRDPESGSYLRVEWVQPPTGDDPGAVWRDNEPGFAGSHGQYQRVDIEPVEYRDYEAAVWEFLYTDGGVRLHAANLGFITNGRGYALLFQTPEDRWAGSQDLFAQFREAFQPTG